MGSADPARRIADLGISRGNACTISNLSRHKTAGRRKRAIYNLIHPRPNPVFLQPLFDPLELIPAHRRNVL